MVPISGKVRENVGLLGSPAFEIPRSVERDSSFDQLKQGDGLRRGLAAKNRHNFVTILWCLFARWFFMFMLTVLMGIAGDFYASLGAAVILLDLVLAAVLGIAYWILVERIVTGFKPLPVLFCSLYEPAMWRHERYWKVPSTPLIAAFVGTPFINMILRRVGTRIGRRVFNDGCAMTERSLVTIGDDCTLNETSWIQCHSQEDGTFKSDYSTLGSNVTLGTGSLVHYGVTIGDGVVIAPDSFVMKGEEVPAGEHWGGNPAIEMRFPAALDRTPAREMPIPAALGENPTRRIPFPALDRIPAREMPVPAVLSPNPAREMPVPAALRENRTITIPFPAALDGIPAGEMSAPVALEVRQDRDESRSAALVGSY